LEDPPGGLDVGEILFALILAAALLQQAMLAPDAFQSAMAERQIELANQAARAKGKQLLAKSNHLLLQFRRSLIGMVMRSAGEFDQTTRPLLLKTAQPFAHCGNGGLKKASGRLDALLPGAVNQPQAMIVSVAHLADQDEVRGGHSGL